MDQNNDKTTPEGTGDMKGRRRRWTSDEKKVLVRETYLPGMTVSSVARKYGIGASQLFNWRKQEREGGLTKLGTGMSAVPAAELAAAREQIAELQRMLGRKTTEAQILREAVEYARERKWIARWPLPSRDTRFNRSVSR